MVKTISYDDLREYFDVFKAHFDEASALCGKKTAQVQNEFYNVPEQRELACGDLWKHSTFTKDGHDIETYSKWLKLPFECSGIISANSCKEDWFRVLAWREKKVDEPYGWVYSFALYNSQGKLLGELEWEDPVFCPWWGRGDLDNRTVYSGDSKDTFRSGLGTILNITLF